MLDIITIGSAVRDVFLKSKYFRIIKSPKFFTGKAECFGLGSKIPIEELVFTTGGSGTNTAATFVKQGLKTAAIVRVGNDLGGRTMIDELKNLKIDTRFIQIDKDDPTAYSIILIAPTGERTILVFRGAGEDLNDKEVNWGVIKTKWIYLASLGGNLSFVKKAVEFKKKYGTKLTWNPGGADLRLGFKKLQPYLKFIDVFSCNSEEAAELLGISYKEERKIFKRFDEVIDGIAVMTKGPRGVSVSDGKYLYQVGIFKEKKVVDRTGAGDAFGAGFIAGLFQNQKSKIPGLAKRSGAGKNQKFTEKDIEYAIRLGTANATSVVEHIGAKPGILTKSRFLKESRWKKLKIIKQKL